ncbi:MAG TPA: YciI family protein [Puia sp.]|nr:YciI family protein [Puia sp.]
MDQGMTIREKMETASQLEKDGRLSDAAAIYQKLFSNDPSGEKVIGRLLVLYRQLKDYKKELSVLNDAIAAYRQQQKSAREKWIQSHPKAASAGRSILRQLEKTGEAVTGLGENHVVERWMKRKQLVTSRITGVKVKKAADPGKVKKVSAPQHKAKTLPPRQSKSEEKQRQRQEAAAIRKKAAQDRKETIARKKREERERKAAEASLRKEKQAQKKAEAVRKRAEADRKKAEAKGHPLLFVVILRYLVPLEEIDAVLKQHMAYLDKHYKNGDFLVSGRQVPRTGGVILARAKNRNAVEKTIEQDPFIKRKLASAEIIAFTASQSAKGLDGWLHIFT